MQRPLNYSEAGSSIRASSSQMSLRLTEKSPAKALESHVDIDKNEKHLDIVEEAETQEQGSQDNVKAGPTKPAERGDSLELFEGQCPYENAWWIQKVFFSWVAPLVHFARRKG